MSTGDEGSSGTATRGDAAKVPRPAAAGPEMAALGRFWRWIVLDCEQDQFLEDGTFVLTWQLHWVSGWAPEHSEYRAVMTDNYGHADVYRGHIDGDRLVFESLEGAGPRPSLHLRRLRPGRDHLAQ